MFTSLLSIHRTSGEHFTLFSKSIWVQKSKGIEKATLRLVLSVFCGSLRITLLKYVTSVLGRKHWLSDLFPQSLQRQKFLWRMSQRNKFRAGNQALKVSWIVQKQLQHGAYAHSGDTSGMAGAGQGALMKPSPASSEGFVKPACKWWQQHWSRTGWNIRA